MYTLGELDVGRSAVFLSETIGIREVGVEKKAGDLLLWPAIVMAARFPGPCGADLSASHVSLFSVQVRGSWTLTAGAERS